jgi:hypothetical protein
MMFCQPVALISQPFDVLRQFHRPGDCAACGLTRSHADKIQH